MIIEYPKQTDDQSLIVSDTEIVYGSTAKKTQIEFAEYLTAEEFRDSTIALITEEYIKRGFNV